MDWILGIALLAGFGPALILMDLILKNYTYPRVENPFFKDSTLFGMFTVGIVEGAVLFFAIAALGLLSSTLGILYMILMSIVELMAMLLVMNLKRFRGKSDSIFYGYSLGLGLAASMSAGFVYQICVNAVTFEVVDYPMLVFYSASIAISLSLIFGACGTNIGEGIARHIPVQFMYQAAIPLVAYNMLLAASFLYTEGLMYILLLLALLLVGAFYFRRCLFINLPMIVREVLKMNGVKRDDIPKN